MTYSSLSKRMSFAALGILFFSSMAFASTELSPAISESLKVLHPNAEVLAADIDEDGIYRIELSVKDERFLVEITRSGRVVSNESQGKLLTVPQDMVNLPVSIVSAIKKLYPQGRVLSATLDDDGIFNLLIDTPQGHSAIEATRSGRILSNDRDASDQDEDSRGSNHSIAQHIQSVRKLPATVLLASEKAHPQGVIVHVHQDLYGPRYGRSEYYLTIVNGENVYDVGLSSAGDVLQDRIDNQTERLERLTQIVKSAVRSTFPSGVIYGSSMRNGIFQVDVLVDGLPYDLEITKEGQILSNKRDYHD